MTKKDLIKEVGNRSGLTRGDVATMFNALREVFIEKLAEGEEIPLFSGLRFITVDVEERTCRNPQTGESMVVPAHKAPKAKIGAAIKQAVR